MWAEIFPFPAERRRAFVKRLASQISMNAPRAAENILRARLSRHADNLAAKGVSPDLIYSDLRRLESAVRSELLRNFHSGDGRA
jgi:Family of unknown function (DUF6074)